jgi:hypothetical protein
VQSQAPSGAYAQMPCRSHAPATITGDSSRWQSASRLPPNNHDGTTPALRAFFNGAMRADAGRLVESNPFAGLRLRQSRGRRDVQPPADADAARLIATADELTPRSFAA